MLEVRTVATLWPESLEVHVVTLQLSSIARVDSSAASSQKIAFSDTSCGAAGGVMP